MTDLDHLLIRTSEIFLDDLADETDAELGELLPPLVEAGYVAIDGESPTGYFWSFTEQGVRRQEELGFLQ
jgi:hypothetical protein